jgi:hypothetical protein
MIFGYFILTVALIISAIAEYYSIVGLMAIFAASPIAVAVMGAALGVGKITGAVWLKINWARAKWTYKVYLCSAVVLLMMLTSIGCFGFLSKAHSDQSLIGGDVQSKIAIYDEKIKTAKENIEADRRQLRQMDEAVDQVMARSTTEEGATKSNAIRRAQARDRAALAKSIEANQKLISVLNDESAPIRAEVRKVEAEVGPIKYIAALVYGDNPDANLLEAAVRWVIILIVAVFDPLALVLILAAQQSIRWAKEEREKKELEKLFQDDTRQELENDPELNITPDPYVADVGEQPTQAELEEIKESLQEEKLPSVDSNITAQSAPPENDFDISKHTYLNKPFVHFKNLKPMVYKPEPVVEPEVKPVATVEVTADHPGQETQPEEKVLPSKFVKVPETAPRVKVESPPVPETLNLRKLQPDNAEATSTKSGFGIKFPDSSAKGDMFLRVDYLPNKLFKHNGFKWIEVDKDKTDSYTYDEQYIQYLIEKIKSGEYEIDQLSDTEQDLVAQQLQKNNAKT